MVSTFRNTIKLLPRISRQHYLRPKYTLIDRYNFILNEPLYNVQKSLLSTQHAKPDNKGEKSLQTKDYEKESQVEEKISKIFEMLEDKKKHENHIKEDIKLIKEHVIYIFNDNFEAKRERARLLKSREHKDDPNNRNYKKYFKALAAAVVIYTTYKNLDKMHLLRDNTVISKQFLSIFSRIDDEKLDKFLEHLYKSTSIIPFLFPSLNSAKVYCTIVQASYLITSEHNFRKAEYILEKRKKFLEDKASSNIEDPNIDIDKLYSDLKKNDLAFPTLYVQTIYHLERCRINEQLDAADKEDRFLQIAERINKLRELIDSDPVVEEQERKFNSSPVSDTLLIQRQMIPLRKLLKAEYRVSSKQGYSFNELYEIYKEFKEIGNSEETSDSRHIEICQNYAVRALNCIGDNFIIYPKYFSGKARSLSQQDTIKYKEIQQEIFQSLQQDEIITSLKQKAKTKGWITSFRLLESYAKFYTNYYLINGDKSFLKNNEDQIKEIYSAMDESIAYNRKFNNDHAVHNKYLRKIELDILTDKECKRLQHIKDSPRDIKQDPILCKRLEQLALSKGFKNTICKERSR